MKRMIALAFMCFSLGLAACAAESPPVPDDIAIDLADTTERGHQCQELYADCVGQAQTDFDQCQCQRTLKICMGHPGGPQCWAEP